MTITFWVYVVMDSRDAVWIGLTDRIAGQLLVDNLQDVDGNTLSEEMGACLIPSWCMEHGLRCVCTVREVTVELPT